MASLLPVSALRISYEHDYSEIYGHPDKLPHFTSLSLQIPFSSSKVTFMASEGHGIKMSFMDHMHPVTPRKGASGLRWNHILVLMSLDL